MSGPPGAKKSKRYDWRLCQVEGGLLLLRRPFAQPGREGGIHPLNFKGLQPVFEVQLVLMVYRISHYGNNC